MGDEKDGRKRAMGRESEPLHDSVQWVGSCPFKPLIRKNREVLASRSQEDNLARDAIASQPVKGRLGVGGPCSSMRSV